MERVVKTETQEEEEVEVEEEQQEPPEPKVPPPTQVSMECQTDESFLLALQKEEPVPREGSLQKEESGEPQAEPKGDVQKDDTAPKQEPAKRLYYGCDITGIQFFENLEIVFQMVTMMNGQASTIKVIQLLLSINICSGMSSIELPRHFTQTIGSPILIARHKDQLPPKELEEFKNTCEYGCSDPRLHWQHQEDSEEASREAEKRIDDDFNSLTRVLRCYIEDRSLLPYCVVLQCLASRYLGGGMLDTTFIDETHPYRCSPQFSLVFWNLGNWCRSRFEQYPLPERLQGFVPHIDHQTDNEHKPIGDNKPQFNNYFINIIKNCRAHLLMNCKAGTIYPHRVGLKRR